MEQNKKRLYYGWIIVIAGFFINFVNTGFLLYTFSLFAVQIIEELNVARTQVILASSLYTLAFAVLSPIVGGQLQKGRVKQLLLLGAIVAGIGFITMSRVSNLPMFYALYIVIGIGLALAGPAVHSALPAIWFDKHRGLAVGIVNCGAGIGAIIAPQIVTFFIKNYSWRMAYVVLGILTILILGIVAFVVKSKPQDIGLLPDGITPKEYAAMPKGKAPVLSGLTREAAMKTPAFWMIGLALLVLGVAQIGVLQNQASHLMAIEFDMAMAAGALGIIGFMTTISKFVYGWVVDRIGYKITVVLGNLPLFIGILMLYFAKPGFSAAYMYIYAVLFGFGLGSWTPVISVAIGKSLGPKFYGAIWGVLFAIRTVGDIIGPTALSGLADAFGGYQVSLLLSAAAVCVSTVLVLLVRQPEAYQKAVQEEATQKA